MSIKKYRFHQKAMEKTTKITMVDIFLLFFSLFFLLLFSSPVLHMARFSMNFCMGKQQQQPMSKKQRKKQREKQPWERGFTIFNWF